MDSENLLVERVTKAADGGAHRLLVDLSGIDYIDSHGLGQMVACHHLLRSQEGRIRFVGLSEKLRRLVEMTRLPRVLEFDPDLASGLRNLSQR